MQNDQNRDESDKSTDAVGQTRDDELSPWEKFHRERITRRAALKRIGITTGAASAILMSEQFMNEVLGRLGRDRQDEVLADALSSGLQDAAALLSQPLNAIMVTYTSPPPSSSSKSSSSSG